MTQRNLCSFHVDRIVTKPQSTTKIIRIETKSKAVVTGAAVVDEGIHNVDGQDESVHSDLLN